MLAAGCVPHPELGSRRNRTWRSRPRWRPGAADAGLAVRAVAESAGLDWVPVIDEPFELALDPAPRRPPEPLLDGARRARSPGTTRSDAGLRPLDERRARVAA